MLSYKINKTNSIMSVGDELMADLNSKPTNTIENSLFRPINLGKTY